VFTVTPERIYDRNMTLKNLTGTEFIRHYPIRIQGHSLFCKGNTHESFEKNKLCSNINVKVSKKFCNQTLLSHNIKRLTPRLT
jgi:hypothetical protein